MPQQNGLMILSLGFLFLHLTLRTNSIEIQIKDGKLKGTTMMSRNGTRYHVFLGIPFAKPPIGNLRFESPQEPDAWDDVRDATIPPPSCIQSDCIFARNMSSCQISGQEDCLYLNVFTPSINENQKLLPTIVVIHGGGFIGGSSTFQDPYYFMDYPVVVVTIQYRLGVLGFLSTVDTVAPGNYGMKDQSAALKWVQKNIASFRGDPNQVTINGESAGGGSVHLHMHSPLSKGLFQRAISQSGSALALWATTSPNIARQKAYSFALLSGCPIESSRALVNCLKKIPVEEFIEIHNKFYVFDMEPTIHFSIVIEPKSVPDAFLVENPWIQGVLSDVPFMVGITSGEGGLKVARFLSDDARMAVLNKQYERIFPLLMGYFQWAPASRLSEISKIIKQFYLGDEEMGENTSRKFVDLTTDFFFAYDCMEAAIRHPTNTYFYYYDHRNARSFNEVFGSYDGELGVSHADDLISLFYLPYLFPKVTEGDDLEVSRRMVNYWVNFVKTGNPNGEGDLWQPLESEEFEYLHITTKEDTMKKHLLKERYEFVKSLQIHPSNKAEDFYPVRDEL